LFAISDELARAFTNGDQQSLGVKTKEFEKRKKVLVKKIN